jgi:DNA-binding NarL/FixJ family response regulator
MAMIRLFVIEDHHYIIDGLKYEFRSSRDEIRICGSASNIEEATSDSEAAEADIFILDLWLGDSQPVDNLKKLQVIFPDIPVIIFTGEESPFWKKMMIDAGAKAYIIKNAGKNVLKSAILKVVKGETIRPSVSLEGANMRAATNGLPSAYILKPSEKEIFSLMAQGIPQKQIADLKRQTPSAIEKVIRKVKKQYHFTSTPELIHYLTLIKEI